MKASVFSTIGLVGGGVFSAVVFLSGCSQQPQYQLGAEATLDQQDMMKAIQDEEREYFTQLRKTQATSQPAQRGE